MFTSLVLVVKSIAVDIAGKSDMFRAVKLSISLIQTFCKPNRSATLCPVNIIVVRLGYLDVCCQTLRMIHDHCLSFQFVDSIDLPFAG